MKESQPPSWGTTTIGAVADVIPGFAFKSKDWCDEGIPVVKIKNLVGDLTVNMDECDFVPNDLMADRLNKFVLHDGDLLIAMTGATAGKTGKLRCSKWMLLNQRVAKLVPRKMHPEFFWAIISSNDYQRRFFYLADGAAQPNMSGRQIEGVEIPEPPLDTQSKIAFILSAYDDLIENNTRRIAILEEMAQLIFRQWFVEFRFPGHESAKFVDSPFGEIPEGWEATTLGDLAEHVRRSVKPQELDPDTPYFGLEHLPRKSITLGDWGFAADVESTKHAFLSGEILFGKIRPYFHKVGFAPFDGICSSDAIVIASKETRYFAPVLCCVSSASFVDHATQTSQGTKMPRANWDVLTKYPLPLPQGDLLQRFNNTVNDIVAMLKTLMLKNRNLRITRNLLLPKLISGQLDVDGLDLDMAEPLEELEEATT